MTVSMITKAIAPGRICLFGEHQDYLQLPVISAAFDRFITITAEPDNSEYLNIHMPDIGQFKQINIFDDSHDLDKRDYLCSAIRVLRCYDCFPDRGYKIHISGAIPINAGASSSSALTVAWVRLLLELYCPGKQQSIAKVARIAYEAEVLEHGEPGGMMDQYTIAYGNIVRIDPSNSAVVTIGDSLEGLILGDSKTSKETLTVLYNLRSNVTEAIAILQSRDQKFKLSNLSDDDINKHLPYLPENLRPFFIAAVKNHMITQQALVEFNRMPLNLEKIGALMTAHHRILRDYLKVTTTKIDDMINVALKAGSLGAKINGSGGGGSIVILAPGKEDQVIAALEAARYAYHKIQVVQGVTILP